nr:MCE family protein [Solirubrobacterales bacterium]
MRRLATLTLLLLGLGVFAVVAGGAAESDPGNEYFVELDNAFGLVDGADMKIAGVRAGQLTRIKLDRKTKRAVVGFRITRDGFGSIRTDATCATRPQSLIGEYYIDCQPGTAAQKLPENGRIPVERTTTTIGPDLVNTVLRRPYAERLSIILNELGAGVAGNGENLDDAIRRASPALRETDKVLAKLARQNATLVQLTENADTVIGDLDANREDVGRWVLEARDTARISATRKEQLAEGFRRLPAFLDELTPTMRLLGQTADAQTPALRDLQASARPLGEFLDRLGPFAKASDPAVDALGEASKTGDEAVRAAEPVVTQLRRTARGAPEAAKNLAIVLEHLNDPKNALEDDPRAAKATGRPAPTGYTGLESFLTYAYDQTLSTNIYDQNNHLLKIGLIVGGECADYADVARAKEVGEECSVALGPNQPGINFTDTTAFEADAEPGARSSVPGPAGPAGIAPPTVE